MGGIVRALTGVVGNVFGGGQDLPQAPPPAPAPVTPTLSAEAQAAAAKQAADQAAAAQNEQDRVLRLRRLKAQTADQSLVNLGNRSPSDIISN
jgi:hypothetical protein